MDQNSYHGALLRRPKLYIHIGAEGTLSTEVLTESLVQNIETLELDGYKVAVHGKFEGKYIMTWLELPCLINTFHAFTSIRNLKLGDIDFQTLIVSVHGKECMNEELCSLFWMSVRLPAITLIA